MKTRDINEREIKMIMREVSLNIFEGAIRSSRQSLLPDKELLDKAEIEVVEAKEEFRQKKTHKDMVCKEHLDNRQLFIDVLDAACLVRDGETIRRSIVSFEIWLSGENEKLIEAKRKACQSADKLRQKKIHYDELYKEYCKKLEDHVAIFAAIGMTIGEMAALLGDLVPNPDKINFFTATALPADADIAAHG